MSKPAAISAEAAQAGQVYVARQPILDGQRRVYGYELLYRHSPTAEGGDRPSDDEATAHLICNGLMAIGLDTLTDGRRAFINVSRRFLVQGIPAILPPNRIVFELGADIEADSEVIAACTELRRAGYQLAIDDYVNNAWTADLVPLVDYLKVDFLREEHSRAMTGPADAPGPAALVAKKVETVALFEEAVSSGYTYFQGYFFGKPVIEEGRRIPQLPLGHLRLLRALNDPDLSVHQLEELVKPDPSLCYRILRTINSAGYAMQATIQSIREALVLLGRDTVRRWASLWALSGISQHAHSEVMAMAAIRARCCELLGASTGSDDAAAEGFLLGICSMLDVILETSMINIVQELPLPEDVQAALLGIENQRRYMLDCTIAYERGEWERSAELAQQAGVKPSALPAAYAEALRWARELQKHQ